MRRRSASVLRLAVLVSLTAAGCTPSIHDLVNQEDLERAKAMLEAHPALVNARNKLGKTPLHHAVTYGHSEFITLFLEHGADINAADKTGLTALHVAAMMGRQEEASLLITQHADLEARDAFGDTPLQLAAIHGQKGMVELLARAGASVQTKNNEGLTPRDSGRKNHRHDAVVDLDKIQTAGK